MEDINKTLMDAVSRHDISEVRTCLEKGADPNYKIPDGDPCYKDFDRSIPQPDTPLRLVMFCISDNFLDEDGLEIFAEIAKMLIEHGADPKAAMEIAEFRYGKYHPDLPDNSFMKVWRIVADSCK